MLHFRAPLFRTAFRAFTLVELLTVIVIVGILGAVALPAYNNYTLKSKFSEVVLATAPTKTAISACAVSGDCLSGQGSSAAISLAGPQTSSQTCTTSIQNVCQTQTYQNSWPNNSSCYYWSVGRVYLCTQTVCSNQSVTTCAAASAASLMSLPCVGSDGCSPSSKYVSSVSYDQSGVIYGAAVASSGLKGETVVLTPSYAGGRVDWTLSGSCKTRGGGALC